MTRLLSALAVLLSVVVAGSALAQSSDQRARRTRIVITPQQGYTVVEPPPSARRYCRSWLERDLRFAGNVVAPRMQCWWQ